MKSTRKEIVGLALLTSLSIFAGTATGTAVKTNKAGTEKITQPVPGKSAEKINETRSSTEFVDKLISKQYVERIKIGKQSFTKITSEGREIMPRIYEAWDRIFENIENLVDDKNYLKEMSTRIRDFTDLIEENHKKGI